MPRTLEGMMNREMQNRFQQPGRAAPKQYDLADFARKHGLSAVKAREILEKAGDSRESADLLAKRSKPVESFEY
jgi:hypothetical protein